MGRCTLYTCSACLSYRCECEREGAYWEMKAPFCRLALHAIWRRRKDLYYAVSFISIAGNLILLARPTLQASAFSLSRLLQNIGLRQTAAFSYIGLLPKALQAVSSAGELQIRFWNAAFPKVVELVLQRSVLCILLNLIVAKIIFKSGILRGKKSSQSPFYMKQEKFHSSGNLFVCGSHWLAPSYLRTVCSTMWNLADVQIAGPSMLLQHAHHYHTKSVIITDASMTKVPVSKNLSMHHLHNDSSPQGKKDPAPTARPVIQPVVPCTPSLFTIEPLDEVVQSMKAQHVALSEPEILSRHPLRKVPTKVDMVQEVQSQRHKAMTLKTDEFGHEPKIAQRIKHNHANVRKEHDILLAIKHGKLGHACDWTEFDLVREDMGVNDDDNLLSRREFKKRVDTFIYKVKKNINMQRQDSLNRLLGLY